MTVAGVTLIVCPANALTQLAKASSRKGTVSMISLEQGRAGQDQPVAMLIVFT